MLFPLWVPWTAAAALAATALLVTREHQRGAAGQRRDLLVLARIWAATAVVLTVACWLSVDRVWVREGELYDAVQAATQQEDGQVDEFSGDRLGAEIADRLGRDVNVEGDRASTPLDDAESDYLVRLRSADGTSSGPTICVRMTQENPTTDPESGVTTARAPMSFGVSTGRCAG